MAVLFGGLAGPAVVDRVTEEIHGGADPATAEIVDGPRTYSPFLVEPTVRFEEATPPEPPRTRDNEPAPEPAAPERLLVPRLGVDAAVRSIDAPAGVLRPPDDPQVLGWWGQGAAPGAGRGSALITGHTVSTGGGALDDLEILRPGDGLAVRTAGELIRYSVTGVTVYGKASLARDAQRVFSQSVPGRLVLITCEDWNGVEYLSNVVVLAEPTG